MGKPSKHSSVRDMSQSPSKKKRKPKPPQYYGGAAGSGKPVEAVPPAERDWFEEGKCANCHRVTARKILTRNVTLEDKALCGKCFDRVPTHLRRLPTPEGHKRWEYRTFNPTDKQMAAMRRKQNAASNAIFNSIPGTTIAEKLDSIERGLADKDPRFVARDKADWDRFVREQREARQRGEVE